MINNIEERRLCVVLSCVRSKSSRDWIAKIGVQADELVSALSGLGEIASVVEFSSSFSTVE